MTTPNNAAALERLAKIAANMKNLGALGVPVKPECVVRWADELATLRATLTQPDALTSQPSEVKRWQPSSFMEPGRSHVYARMQESDHGAFVLFDDYQKLLNSQPSGESVAWMVVERENGPPVKLCYDREDASDWIVSASSEYRNQQCPGPSYRTLPLYTHPSADAPGVAVDEWRPIESAPAGVPILVRYVNSAGKERVIKARFIQRFTEESSSDCDEGVDEYDEANDRYTYCEGWWEMIDNWDDFAFVTVSEGSPTHWHKIPSTAALAPKPEGGHG